MPSLNILIEFFSSFSLTFLMQTQMDALTCLKTRRSIRQFTEDPISDEIITEIFRMRNVGHLPVLITSLGKSM